MGKSVASRMSAEAIEEYNGGRFDREKSGYNGYSCTKHPYSDDPMKMPKYMEDLNSCFEKKCSFLRYLGKPVFEFEGNRFKRAKVHEKTADIYDSELEERLKEALG